MTDTYTARNLYQRLRAIGFEPSPEAQRLYAATTEMSSPQSVLADAQKELQASVVAGDPKRTAAAQKELTEAANVANLWSAEEDARTAFANELVAQIVEPAFTHVRDLYGEVGARLAKAVNIVDIDADPLVIMRTASPKAVEAYAGVDEMVQQLKTYSSLLIDIVTASGRRYRANENSGYAGYPLGLLVTVGDAHVRRLIECLYFRGYFPRGVNPVPMTALERACSGRGGKWAGLVRYGATLAVPVEKLADFRPVEVAPVLPGGIDPYDSPAAWARYEAHLTVQATTKAQHDAQVRRLGGVV